MPSYIRSLLVISLILTFSQSAFSEIRQLVMSATQMCIPTSTGKWVGWPLTTAKYRWNATARGKNVRLNGQKLNCVGKTLEGAGLATGNDTRQFCGWLAQSLDDPYIKGRVNCTVTSNSVRLKWQGEAGGKFRPKDKSLFADYCVFIYDLDAKFQRRGNACTAKIASIWRGKLKKGKFTTMSGKSAICAYENLKCALK